MSITSSTEPHGENIVLISFSSQSPSVVRPFPWSTHHLMPMERAFISFTRSSSCCGGPDPLPDLRANGAIRLAAHTARPLIHRCKCRGRQGWGSCVCGMPPRGIGRREERTREGARRRGSDRARSPPRRP